MLVKNLRRKSKLGRKKQLGMLAVLALISISSIIIIQLSTLPGNNPYLGHGLFSSGQGITNYPKEIIYLYPNRNDSDVDNIPSIGSHSYWPNLSDPNISTYDILTESNTNSSNDFTLVPNSAGTTQLYPNPDTKLNWECCNTSDDDSSYVFFNETLIWKLDLYRLENPPVIDGAKINYIEVYIRVKLHLLTESTYGFAVPMLNDPSWLIGEQSGNTFTVDPGDYMNFSSRWDRNPDTFESWNWSDLTELQAGIRVRVPNGPVAEIRCTYVWVVVNYTVPNYELDLELQWTNIPLSASDSNLCIITGNFSSNENLSIWYWNDNSWTEIIHNLQNNTWNNATLKIDNPEFTIRFKDNNETLDRLQDSWEIGMTVVVVNYISPAISPYFALFLGAFLLGGGNQSSISSTGFIIGAVALVSILGLVVGRFYVSGEAASFRKRRIKQLEEARDRVQRYLEESGDGGTP